MKFKKKVFQTIKRSEKYVKKLLTFRGPDNIMFSIKEIKNEENEIIDENEDTSEAVERILKQIKF